MKLKRISVLIFLFAAGVRCSDIDYKNRTEKNKTVSLSPDEKFEVKLQGLDQPNKFKAVVQYSGPNPENWTVIRKSESAKLTSFEIGKDRKGSTEDQDLQPGETYTYEIGKNQDGEFHKAKEEIIKVPSDFVVTGTVELKPEELRSLNKTFRIFFKKDSVLKTNGSDVDLEVEEIFSEGGRFQTFSESDQAPLGRDGKPSGRVHLKTQRFTGPFTIEIRGQKGGEGFKGATGPQGPGGPASTVYVVEYGGLSQRELCTREKYNPPSNSNCFGKPYEYCLWHYHPGVGGKGGIGGQGFQGLPGYRGGDVQNSELEIPLTQDTKIIFEPGAKGPGGHGGDGGPGGPGGPGSGYRNNPPGQPCDPPPQGPPGDTGPEGPRGPEGLPGNKETLTINGVAQ